MPKTTQSQLLQMKKRIIDGCIAKQMKWKEGARLLTMHPKALSRLKKRYVQHGDSALMPKKPGPKTWHPPRNKTSEAIEDIVVSVSLQNLHLGPQQLADMLADRHGLTLNQVTIWRILKRRKVRYTASYQRWKEEPKLYCLDTPGEELQMDACYPYGQARKCASFDAIDDCSRHVFGECYTRETCENAITFVNRLILRVPFRIQRIRVDNKYGKKFVEHCASLGIEVIQNDPYCPEQNGKIERFHRTLKREFFFRHCEFTDSLEELNYKYALWLTHYNSYRRHRGLKMDGLTPAQKLTRTMLQSTANTIMLQPEKVTGTLQQYIY